MTLSGRLPLPPVAVCFSLLILVNQVVLRWSNARAQDGFMAWHNGLLTPAYYSTLQLSRCLTLFRHRPCLSRKNSAQKRLSILVPVIRLMHDN